ncbi:PQQ-dependent sugar dehydrogenase [Cognatiluteimonas profundi]|uniref:PQQ-dependent sugar dehydrogenase n=1 Tax=Cognatiluteimonas profundi TaxID=2594501 RepID=UPI0018EF1319|nr:PQQ-dependent sugar dehydrogenase [Lysobacter profundi]
MMRPAAGTLAAILALAMCACNANPVDAPATVGGKPTAAAASTGDTVIARGLDHPWSVALLPQGGFIVTERVGRLRRIAADGTMSPPIAGVPVVWAQGQGGLLDVALAPDFASSQRIYLSFAEPGPGDSAGTAVAMATLGDKALRDVRVIYRQEPKLVGPNHFGSRIAFDGKGHVFISQGERFDRMRAQQLDMLQGKLVRLNLDGSIPPDNPFVGHAGARPEIWSYGHRNMQGLAIDPRSGRLWESEHGPRGGDEINLPQPGRNYGWPIISNGMDYSTNRPYAETVGTQAPGMEPPYHVWKKSPGLSGMAFYTGHPGSRWNNSLFLGALADRNLIRLTLEGDRIVSEERLLDDLGARIRDVRVGADGSVYVLTDEDDGHLIRLQPPMTGR